MSDTWLGGGKDDDRMESERTPPRTRGQHAEPGAGKDQADGDQADGDHIRWFPQDTVLTKRKRVFYFPTL